MAEGFEEKDKSIWRKMAQMTSWVTAPHLKRPVNPKKLLNNEQESKQRTTPEETANVLAELEADIKVI